MAALPGLEIDLEGIPAKGLAASYTAARADETNYRPLPTQLPDQPRIHLYCLMQLLDCDPFADGVGLVDVAGA